MLPELDSLAGDITDVILREVPEYARPDDDSYALVVHQIARDAVRHFVNRIADPATHRAIPGGAGEPATAERMFRDIGRAEAAAGRSLDALHAALRVGMRVTWQRLRERNRRDGADADVVARVGEAIFRYLDEVCAAGSAGYGETGSELAGEAERVRRRLLDLLLSDPPPLPEAVAWLARAAGWRPPRRVAVVVLAVPAGRTPGLVPPGVLAGLSRREPCLLVPDPDGPGRRHRLESALLTSLLRDRPGPAPLAAVGPAVPTAQAASSLRWARQALDLGRRGLAGSAERIIRCEDHLATLVLLADADLAAVLADHALAPLRGLRPDQADRLAKTLLAWLESADNAGLAARRLHVHPQTVRYRLRQLTELFGDRLIEPDTRFTLQAALRARRAGPR